MEIPWDKGRRAHTLSQEGVPEHEGDLEFTQRFIGQEPRVNKQLALLPDDTAFQGGVPEILKFQGTQELEDFLVKDLKDCVNRGEYKRSEMGEGCQIRCFF